MMENSKILLIRFYEKNTVVSKLRFGTACFNKHRNSLAFTGEPIPKKKTTSTKSRVVKNNSDKKIVGKLVEVLLYLVKK